MLSVSTSLQLILQSDPVLLGLSTLIFDVPRYTLSTFASLFVKSKVSSADTNSNQKISVVISTFNGAEKFSKCVTSLWQQTHPPSEIIVVDDGSTDQTRNVAEALLRHNLISYLFRHGTRCGKSAAINHGARFADGELLLTLDDDAVLEPTALADLARAFDDETVAVASGNLSIRNKDVSLLSSVQAVEYLTSITAGRGFLDLLGSVSCCSGAFSMFRHNVFSAIGGMNVGPGEDLEITLRARKLGYRVRFVSNASAQVDACTTFSELVRQRLRWDRDALRIRIFMFNELSLRKSKENLSDTLQRLDFIIMDLIPTLAFPIYVAFLVLLFGSFALDYLFGIYLILLSLALLNIGIVIVTTPHRLNMFDAAITPILPFYQGIIMKLVRLVAFSTEFLFPMKHESYVPPRVLRALFEPRCHEPLRPEHS